MHENRVDSTNPAHPLASVILLTFNQEKFIKDALNSILQQTYTPLEIIIADDDSNDNTRKIIQETINKYDGPHIIKLVFQEKNLGICENINTALNECNGELIHLAAGDDISLPNRCEIVMQSWLDLDKKPDLIATDVYDMDEQGKILGIKCTSNLQDYLNVVDWIKHPPFFFGCSHSWSKKFINQFERLNRNLSGEDHVMVFRSIINNGAHTISAPYVKYRNNGISSRQKLPLFERIQKAKKKHMTNMVFFEQLLKDAKNDINFKVLEKNLEPKIEQTQFALQMYEPISFPEKMKLFVKASNIPLGLKMKNLMYGSLSSLRQRFLEIIKT